MKTVAHAVFFWTSAFGSSVLRAWVFVNIWEWFVEPLGLPSVNLWHAWGLLLFATLFHHITQADIDLDPKLKAQLTRFLYHAGLSLAVWGLGALLHMGMT